MPLSPSDPTSSGSSGSTTVEDGTAPRWHLVGPGLTLPPVPMLFLGEPVHLILAYGVLGAFFMPFLSVTLL